MTVIGCKYTLTIIYNSQNFFKLKTLLWFSTLFTGESVTRITDPHAEFKPICSYTTSGEIEQLPATGLIIVQA
jgi:hypothetical protein